MTRSELPLQSTQTILTESRFKGCFAIRWYRSAQSPKRALKTRSADAGTERKSSDPANQPIQEQ